MARIRSIKPELPQSESMGNVSREARLCFILLFTVSDDHGKLRGNSRMLASLLYPYDNDAPKLIEKWLDELQRERCIVRYHSDGAAYIKILKWQEHQKVDRPSASKIPDPREDDTIIREDSRGFTVGSEDQGRDQGSKDHSADARTETKPERMPHHDIPADWLAEAMAERGWPQNIAQDIWANFRDYWTTGKGRTTKRTDWRATWRTWYRKENIKTGGQHGSSTHQHGNQKRGGDPASNAYHAAQSIIARRNAAAGISPGAEPAHHAPAADLRLPEDLRRQGGDDGIPRRDVPGDPR